MGGVFAKVTKLSAPNWDWLKSLFKPQQQKAALAATFLRSVPSTTGYKSLLERPRQCSHLMFIHPVRSGKGHSWKRGGSLWDPAAYFSSTKRMNVYLWGHKFNGEVSTLLFQLGVLGGDPRPNPEGRRHSLKMRFSLLWSGPKLKLLLSNSISGAVSPNSWCYCCSQKRAEVLQQTARFRRR